MYRYFLVVILSILIIGCGQNEEAEPRQVTIAKQQATKALWEKQEAQKQLAIALAKQKVAEDQAIEVNTSSQRVIFGLSIGALLAFLGGIGIGSSSRRQAASAAKAFSE